MAAGDITWTYLGIFNVDGSDLKTTMDAESTGAATAGSDTTTFFPVYMGNGQVAMYKMVRESS